MAERVIAQADLTAISNNLGAIHNDLRVLDSGVGTVNDNVKVVYDEIGSLAREFREFVDLQTKANRLQVSETRLVKIRQEIEKKFGHYDIVRRTTTGILQADDLGIVKKETISQATEEMMISTPGYWLAPCLVALAAWINDQPELADRAVREAIKRNDEKTSLFFALICRRADRKEACLKWVQRYLANQDPEKLDRVTVIILDAFASGLLGVDSEGLVSKQMNEWLSHLEEKPGFVEQQTQQWTDAINLKKKPVSTDSYTYLKKYSKTWPQMEEVLEGAYLHNIMLNYLTGVFEQKASTREVKQQLDEILDNLVTAYDDEELPLRKEEKYEQLVVDFGGDERRAKQNMSIEQTSFDVQKDFTQLLTDAAMKPDTSHSSVSTQKFAFALSKDWVTNAYNDIVANNRMKIPNEIEINVDSFNDKTTDGQNEKELIDKFHKLVQSEKENALKQCVLSTFEQYSLYGGAVIAAIGALYLLLGNALFGILIVVAGVGLILNHYSKKKNIEKTRKNIESTFEEKKEKGSQIIRATLAEVVDYREEFNSNDSESSKVTDFLNHISPEEYIRKLGDTNRRIKV